MALGAVPGRHLLTAPGLAPRPWPCHLRGVILPPTLKPGDPVALVAPAGPVDDATIDRAIRRCHDFGFEPRPGASIRARAHYLAGRDHDRAADLRAAIDSDCAAIWALRGGYGTLRTLEHVDLADLAARPRAYIGFSDNTVVHLALRALGLVSFHGPHSGFKHFTATTEQVFRAVLMDGRPAGVLPVPEGCEPVALRGGVAEGPLVGGNLALLAAVCGTRYQPDTRGAILFLEDVEEPAYRIDRMIMQIRLAGLLDGVAGIALGDFSPPDPLPADEPPLQEVLAELLAPLGVPVLAGLPFGHETENWTLPVGVAARLDADAPSLEILEPATRDVLA